MHEEFQRARWFMESKALIPDSGGNNSLVTCRNSQGVDIRATLLRLTRHTVVFEAYNPYSILQLSEVLSDFRIIMHDRLAYAGRAVVTNLVNTGILVVCEASLEESWLDVDLFAPINQPRRLEAEFAAFIREWEKTRRVMPEFKVVVADMQTLLIDLRRWLEQVELGIRSEPAGDRSQTERQVIGHLEPPMLPLVMSWFSRFDEVAERVEEEMRPTCRTYARRQLHPLVLCYPFVYRTFQKPLGYAGDYEMVNMILRDPLEGASLFAKMVNLCFLKNPPAEAHRNRIAYLTRQLRAETRRVAAQHRHARIFNLGCGPAQEVQDFIRQDDLCDQAELTLVDFEGEALEYARRALGQLTTQYRRQTRIQLLKKSVHQILKEASRPVAGPEAGGYDLIYCAGLFDYISDRICQRLMGYFYDLLNPGGLLIATNVDAAKPFRHSMEYLMEWHLICLNRQELAALTPEQAPAGCCTVVTDATGVNIFTEIRKPDHG
jgi:extracellular factor (EF) 3-hydroxypalmitic acid methyl ester biosynthesis protein